MFHKYLTVGLMVLVANLLSFQDAWGYLEPYFASYLRSYDNSLTTSQVHVLYSFTMFVQLQSALLVRLISVYLGHREGLLIGFISIGLAYIIIGSTNS